MPRSQGWSHSSICNNYRDEKGQPQNPNKATIRSRSNQSYPPPNRYRHWDELESTRVSNSGKAIKFWDACTGKDSENEIRFTRHKVDSAFNMVYKS